MLYVHCYIIMQMAKNHLQLHSKSPASRQQMVKLPGQSPRQSACPHLGPERCSIRLFVRLVAWVQALHLLVHPQALITSRHASAAALCSNGTAVAEVRAPTCYILKAISEGCQG